MKTGVFVLPATALALLTATVAIADAPEEDIWAECRSTESCTIEYDHLANQETNPFLFNGKVVDEEHPQWGKYRKTLRRYPDVRDCLQEAERSAKAPNLLMIDWEGVGTSENASVCVFRIAASLGDIERTQAWLAYQGFRFSGINRRVSKTFVPEHEKYPVYNVTASWTVDKYRELNPSWFAAITGYDLVHSYQLVLTFDQNHNIAGVSVVTPTKFN